MDGSSGFLKTNSIEFSNMSDSFGDGEEDMCEYQFGDDTSWPRGMEEEIVEDLVPMFELYNLTNEPPTSEFLPIASLTEKEQHLEDFGPRSTESSEPKSEPIECILVNLAHLEEFPKPASPYSATLPSIFAWFDAHTAFSSEFPTTIQNYFKGMYSSIRQHIRFFFSISPSVERMKNLGTVRREVPTGRVLFHYIGHGFPTITENNLWCSGRRGKKVDPFELSALFKELLPPTWYIFDCSNAGAVINTFKKTAEEQAASDSADQADWNDWLCFCATGKGEELPDDPRLPRDFLTSVLLTPIRMAVICHMLQFYRLNLVGPTFPLDCQYEHLWNEKSHEANTLAMTLTAITDAIASDSLPPELYMKLFRGDRLSAVLYRRFLLAQYLLRPYRVHPVSYPEIPDLSMHPIWRQWGIILDTAICVGPVPRPNLADDLFTRTAVSFEVLIHSDQFDVIKPYHLTLLFHMLLCDPSDDQPIVLLSEYASDPRADHDMLIAATVFNPLFTRLMQKSPTASVFYPLAFLVLILLRDSPEFANDIRKDLDVSHFPSIIFNHEVPAQVRVVCAAITAELVVSHETFQSVCTSKEYLDQISDELKSCDNSIAGWLLIIIRRAFNLYSPDISFFTSNGLHVQCSVAIGSKCYIVRSAALAVLTCFMSPFECKYNSQLFLMSLKAIGDPSFFTRFHFVLLLKKFISSFDIVPERIATVDNFDNSTFAKLHDSIILRESDVSEYEAIDNLMKSEMWKSQSYHAALHLLSMYARDPHPSVASLAGKILQFIAKRKSAFESMDESMSGPSSLSKGLTTDDQYVVCYGDDELEEEHTIFANIDQNDALHQITTRLLITMSRTSQRAAVPNIELTESRSKIINDKIIFVRFMQETNAIIAATYKTVFYVRDTYVRSYTIDDTSICDISDMHGHGYPLVMIATHNGGLLIWDPEQGLNMAIRADSRFDRLTTVLCTCVSNNTVATMSNDGCFCIWNMLSRTIIMEKKIEIPSNINMFDMKDDTIMIGCEDGSAAIFNIRDSDLTIVNRSENLKGMMVSGGKLMLFSDKWEACPCKCPEGLSMRACAPDCCIAGDNIVICNTGDFYDLNGGHGKIDTVEGATCCSGHMKEPFLVFGTTTGEIVCKQIVPN